MPFTDEKTNRDYMRQYMRKRRQAAKAGKPTKPSAAKAEPLADIERRKLEGELFKAKLENDELREQLAKTIKATPAPQQQAELSIVQQVNAELRAEIVKLKAKIAKQAEQLALDPESEAARQIDALKKTNKSLRQKVDRLVPSAVKAKVAKALTEQITSPSIRLDALQAWNTCGLNNIGSWR